MSSRRQRAAKAGRAAAPVLLGAEVPRAPAAQGRAHAAGERIHLAGEDAPALRPEGPEADLLVAPAADRAGEPRPRASEVLRTARGVVVHETIDHEMIEPVATGRVRTVHVEPVAGTTAHATNASGASAPATGGPGTGVPGTTGSSAAPVG